MVNRGYFSTTWNLIECNIAHSNAEIMFFCNLKEHPTFETFEMFCCPCSIASDNKHSSMLQPMSGPLTDELRSKLSEII